MANAIEQGTTLYVNDTNHCPVCGCDEVECNDHGWEREMAYGEMFCLSCHTTYTLWLTPSHVVIQEPGEVE